jgi:hypothetical protein
MTTISLIHPIRLHLLLVKGLLKAVFTRPLMEATEVIVNDNGCIIVRPAMN